MKYHFSKTVDYGFDEAIEKATRELQAQGFGILTEIDVRATLKKKLDVEFRDYRILGACNPGFAYEALQKEDKIGTMLPCNVIVQVNPEGRVEVTVPPSSRPEDKLRLPGRGIPGKKRGDLYVRLKVVLPPADSDKDRQVYENMKREMDFDPRQSLGV